MYLRRRNADWSLPCCVGLGCRGGRHPFSLSLSTAAARGGRCGPGAAATAAAAAAADAVLAAAADWACRGGHTAPTSPVPCPPPWPTSISLYGLRLRALAAVAAVVATGVAPAAATVTAEAVMAAAAGTLAAVTTASRAIREWATAAAAASTEAVVTAAATTLAAPLRPSRLLSAVALLGRPSPPSAMPLTSLHLPLLPLSEDAAAVVAWAARAAMEEAVARKPALSAPQWLRCCQ